MLSSRYCLISKGKGVVIWQANKCYAEILVLVFWFDNTESFLCVCVLDPEELWCWHPSRVWLLASGFSRVMAAERPPMRAILS